MGIYNFQSRFVPKIEADPPDKTHTIRAKRKHPDKPGDPMYLYTGLRRKGARRLRAGGSAGIPTCTAVQDIVITKRQIVLIDNERLSADEYDAFARRDGFKDFADMMSFWDGRLPFNGDIYHWKPAPKSEARAASAPTRKRSAGHKGVGSVARARMPGQSVSKRSRRARALLFKQKEPSNV